MSTHLKRVVVFTVTGSQGSSVARSLLRDGGYEVLGITRNPSSAAAQELAKLGVKLIQGDLNDASTYEKQLGRVYGAYVNADFAVASGDPAVEIPKGIQLEFDQTKAAIEAVVKAGAEHIVYSALDDTQGQVPYFESKTRVIKWAKEKDYPITYLYTSWYYSNLIRTNGFLQKKENGEYLLAFPTLDDTILILYAVEQTGEWVLASLNDPKRYIRKDIQAAAEQITIKQWAEEISQAIGKPVSTLGISKKAFENREGDLQKIPEAYWTGYKWLVAGGTRRDIEASRRIVPNQWDTKAWFENVQRARQSVGLNA